MLHVDLSEVAYIMEGTCQTPFTGATTSGCLGHQQCAALKDFFPGNPLDIFIASRFPSNQA